MNFHVFSEFVKKKRELGEMLEELKTERIKLFNNEYMAEPSSLKQKNLKTNKYKYNLHEKSRSIIKRMNMPNNLKVINYIPNSTKLILNNVNPFDKLSNQNDDKNICISSRNGKIQKNFFTNE